MRSALEALKPVGVLLLCLGGAFAVCCYVAHFTLVQSLVLAVITVIAHDGYKVAMNVAELRQPRFKAFWIRIQPQWYHLCQDYGLYDVGKWEEHLRQLKETPVEYSIFRNGFNFTMLGQNLFFSDDHKNFFG